MCPLALSVGVSYQDFWQGSVGIVDAHLLAHKLREERKEFEFEYVAWLNGSYVYDAVGTILDHAFSKSAQTQYPQKPRLTPTQRANKDSKERKAELEAEQKLIAAKISAWASVFNKKFDKSGQK